MTPESANLSTSNHKTSLIKVRNLHKFYGQSHILKGIDVDVDQGEVVVVIGPSGCGKSTFLRCLNQLEIFQEGTIQVGDHTIHAQPKTAEESGMTKFRKKLGIQSLSERRAERTIREVRTIMSMVFQQFNLFPHLTALENVMKAPVTVLKRDRHEAREKAMALLTKVNLADRAHHYPSELSGGQQQRVAIARALAMEPKGVLFDEPTSALDPQLVGEVLNVMTDLARSGLTMICVTHEMSFAKNVANRVLFFDQGKIAESNHPSKFFTNPETERAKEFLKNYFATHK